MIEVIKKNRKLVGAFAFWVMLHMIFYFVSEKDAAPTDQFWPFTEYAHFEDYDASEFFVYSLSPIFLFIGLCFFGVFAKVNNS